MSRIAVICAVLLLAACGSSGGTTAHGGSSSPSTSSPASSSAPTGASTSGSASASATATATAADGLPAAPPAPDGVWDGPTAAAQIAPLVNPFIEAKNGAVGAVNAMGQTDLPSDADFPAAFAPIAAKCAASRKVTLASVKRLTDAHAAGHWSPAEWKVVSKAVRELRWWAGEETQCTKITTKTEMLAWGLGYDFKRADGIGQTLIKARDTAAAS